jgi:hypothetical protein
MRVWSVTGTSIVKRFMASTGAPGFPVNGTGVLNPFLHVRRYWPLAHLEIDSLGHAALRSALLMIVSAKRAISLAASLFGSASMTERP